jgi:PAS domain S-box-containing protein
MSKRHEEDRGDERLVEVEHGEARRIEIDHQVALQELETYREETRIQTEQLIEAQRMLEESRDRYADLYETAPIAYLTLDEHGVIRDINLTGARLFGASRASILESPFVVFVDKAHRRSWIDHMQKWNESAEQEFSCELVLVAAGRSATVQLIARAVEREGGSIYRVALIDRTDQKDKEEEIRRLNQSLEQRVVERTAELAAANDKLRALDRRKDEFVASLGHELRNPLASITNGLELLKVERLPAPHRAEAIRIMERQLGNMTAMLNDLLDISRITLGKIRLHQRLHDINELVRSAIQSCAEIIAARHHRLEVELCGGDPCPAHCDGARVEQMIVNLLQNAAKYTDPDGVIRVSSRREGSDVRIDVVDNGCGMSEETRARAFELFSQADTTIDRSQGGLGIGLTMVRSLVELHGGRVEAFSEGPGTGSRFTLWLPCHPADRTEPLAGEAPDAKDDVSLRVVVVEDNVDSAHLLQLLLRRWGHDAEVVHNGTAGIELVSSSRPDVAIIDIGLPGVDGYAVARRLREQFSPQQLLLVAITGYGSGADQQRAAAAGFDKHLIKPVSPESLRAALRPETRPPG